jgi:hypothetical protein
MTLLRDQINALRLDPKAPYPFEMLRTEAAQRKARKEIMDFRAGQRMHLVETLPPDPEDNLGGHAA